MAFFSKINVMLTAQWQKNAHRSLVLVIVGLLCGCGGSSSSNPGPDAGTAADAAGLLTGVFLDSPVAGLSWVTSSGGSGQTNAAGEFQYLENDTITFSVGSVELGSIKAASRITPFDLVGFEIEGDKLEFKDFALDIIQADAADTVTKFEQGINMLIFLQSLDDDNNARNGIAFPFKVLEFFSTILTTVLFDLDTREFVNFFLGIFVQLVDGDFLTRDADDKPIDRDDALEHFLLQQAQS